MPVGLSVSCLAVALLSSVEPLGMEADSVSEEPLFATRTELDQIGRILAPVMINGRGPFRMLVDTGASRTSVSPNLAQALGLVATADRTVLLNGVTGSAQVPVVTLNKLQAGDFVVTDTDAPIVHAPIMAGADGILGVASFTTERIVVDFQHDRIEISRARDRDHSFRPTTTVHAKRIPGGLLAVTAMVGRVPTQLIIDTGGERTLGNLALRNALLGRKVKMLDSQKTEIYGATLEQRSGQMFYAPRIAFGDLALTDVAVIFGDFHVFKVWGLEKRPVMLLGMDVLGVLDQLVIDYRHQELRVRVRSSASQARNGARSGTLFGPG